MATTSRLSAPPSLCKAFERFQDPIVDEVRLVRRELSARFQGDLKGIAKDLMKRQKTLGPKLRRLK
jgi:hypothetical protein